MPTFDESHDIVVAGYGFAGGAAAIAAADAGGSALLLEKMPDPGGISITAGGGIRISETAEAAFEYIRASNAGRTPDENIRPIADGMVWLTDWLMNWPEVAGRPRVSIRAKATIRFPVMTNSRFSKSRRFRILTRRCNTRMRAHCAAGHVRIKVADRPMRQGVVQGSSRLWTALLQNVTTRSKCECRRR